MPEENKPKKFVFTSPTGYAESSNWTLPLEVAREYWKYQDSLGQEHTHFAISCEYPRGEINVKPECLNEEAQFETWLAEIYEALYTVE